MAVDDQHDVLDIAGHRLTIGTKPAMAAVAIAAVAASGMALHYRSQVRELREDLAKQRTATRVERVATSPPSQIGVVPTAEAESLTTAPPPPVVLSVELVPTGTVRGDVTLVVQPRSESPVSYTAQVTVVGHLSGVTPNMRYKIDGVQCSAGGESSQWTWAEGTSDESGRVTLTGKPKSVRYNEFLTLDVDLGRTDPGPVVNGAFGLGQAKAWPAGREPCAP